MDLEKYPLSEETRDGLLDRLQEECADVIKACSKAKRFGFYNHDPSQKFSNSRNIANELADVLEIRDYLFRRGLLP